MSIALRDPPDLAGGAGGIVARRAVARWGWRLFRREWRQQLLVFGLLTAAVAATIWGASVVTNVQLPNPDYATFGTAAVQVTLPGSDPSLAADITAIAGRWGPADVIETQDIPHGTTQPVQLRAESPRGHYNSPLLSLVSGTYPVGPGQAVLTSQVAALYGAHVGGTWQAAGTTWRATTFAVFLAMAICLVASIRFDNPLDWIGPNLSSSQLIFYTQQSPAPGQLTQLSNAQAARLGGQVDSLAASLHARSAVPLESSAWLYQVGAQAHGPSNFTGTVYVATPQLLATYGIKASQIAPGTDFLTMRPGLAGLPHMEMLWGTAGSCTGTCLGNPANPGADGGPPCTLSNDCLANPAIQTVSNLPDGTSAPNTVITESAVSKYHLQSSLNGWLIQAPAPLTATQISAAKRLALAYGVTFETKSDNPDAGEFADGATALGIVIAFGVLAASVGLIRSETARDLRTLTATGASGATRRMITAATAAALGLLGAILGMAGAVIAGLAWAHGSLSAMFGDLPLSDVLILLVGLPLVAAVAGWLLAGREPPLIARQPIE